MADLYVPTGVDDAVAFLAAHAPGAFPVAGGTDLMVDTRIGRVAPRWLVDLTGLRELSGLRWDGDRLVIGALTRIRAIETDTRVISRATALAEAARVLGSVQIRVMATVGGNVCHATPSAEMPPALLAHDADATVVGPHGVRTVPLAGVFAGPGLTTLAPGELLASLEAVARPSCYLRQTVRWSMDLAGVGVAAAIEACDGTVTAARIALGAVSPVPMRVPEAEGRVVGTAVEREVAGDGGRSSAAACSPITEARGRAE